MALLRLFNTAKRGFGKITEQQTINMFAARKRLTIFGSRAMNAQLPGFLQRPARDTDLISQTPRKTARELAGTLNAKSGGRNFFVRRARFPGTFKVVDVGMDGKRNTRDDIGVADVGSSKRKVKVVVIGRNRFVARSEVERDRVTALRDPMFAFRHEQDRDDLKRIRLAKRLERGV